MNRLVLLGLAGVALLLPMAARAQSFTSTACLQITKPVPGNPAFTNSWGSSLNSNFDLLDQASAGDLSLNLPAAAGYPTVILTSTAGSVDQSRNAHFVFSGVLTQNTTVLWPNGLCRIFSVSNQTTGAFTLTIAVNNGSGGAAGTTLVIPQSIIQEVVDDGTNMRARSTAGGAPINVQQTLGVYPSAVNAPSGTALTLTAANAGQIISSRNAGGSALYTLPNPGTVGNGYTISFFRETNNITVQTGSGAIFIKSPLGSFNSYGLSGPQASAVFSSDGANWSVTGSSGTAVTHVNYRAFTNSGTYVPPAALLYATFVCVGGGGGGGGVLGNTNGSGGGGGGGGGASTVVTLSVATIVADGGSEIITIGAPGSGGGGGGAGGSGGTTSLGTRCSAFGGSGASANASGSGWASGGGGGGGGTGDAIFPGPTGGNALALPNTSTGTGGTGASTQWGGGGIGNFAFGGCNNGGTATGFGAGGGGAAFGNNPAACTGGNGSPGIVLVTEYLSQ